MVSFALRLTWTITLGRSSEGPFSNIRFNRRANSLWKSSWHCSSLYIAREGLVGSRRENLNLEARKTLPWSSEYHSPTEKQDKVMFVWKAIRKLTWIDVNPRLFQVFNDKEAFDCLFKIARDLTTSYPQKGQIFHPIFEDDFVENIRSNFPRFLSGRIGGHGSKQRAKA